MFFQPTTAANPVEDLLIQEIDRQKSWDRRETRVLWLYLQGFTQEEIALIEGIARRTVIRIFKKYLARCHKKG